MAIPTNMQYFNELLGEQLGGGGGGSSDFSTAQVTFVNNSSDPLAHVLVPVVSISEDDPSIQYVMARDIGTGEHTVILHGEGTIVIPDVGYTIAASGDAEVDPMGIVLIKGDCTLTLLK